MCLLELGRDCSDEDLKNLKFGIFLAKKRHAKTGLSLTIFALFLDGQEKIQLSIFCNQNLQVTREHPQLTRYQFL